MNRRRLFVGAVLAAAAGTPSLSLGCGAPKATPSKAASGSASGSGSASAGTGSGAGSGNASSGGVTAGSTGATSGSKGPGGNGVFFAVTTGNDVYALDETDGHDVWGGPHNIGMPAAADGPPPYCGNIHPLGILSTPVIDAAPGPDGFATIYVAGAVGEQYIERHEVHALSVKDGSERAGWPINVSAIQASASTAAGITNFHLTASDQRSALSLVNGILYVAYGGHVGDCDTYHGWVIAIDTSNPAKTGAWVTAGQGEAIWAAGGMASDGTGVIAVTSNRNGGGGPHQDSEEVVRITGLATLARSNATIFYPSNWDYLDGNDLDFGSSSPVFVQVGAGSYVAALTKNGDFYLLDAANFGGTDPGNLVPPNGSHLTVAQSGMSIRTAPAFYTSAAGAHVAFNANGAEGCPMGAGTSIMSVLLSPGAPPTPNVAWCASTSGQTSPIATTSDGTADALVWFVNGTNLVALDGDTGAVVVTATGGCNNVRQWTSPIALKGRVVAGGDGNLCSWSVH